MSASTPGTVDPAPPPPSVSTPPTIITSPPNPLISPVTVTEAIEPTTHDIAPPPETPRTPQHTTPPPTNIRGVSVPPPTFFDTKNVLSVDYNKPVQPANNSTGGSTAHTTTTTTTSPDTKPHSRRSQRQARSHSKPRHPPVTNANTTTNNTTELTHTITTRYKPGSAADLLALTDELCQELDITYIYCDIYDHTPHMSVGERLRIEQILNSKLNAYVRIHQAVLPLYSKHMVECWNHSDIDTETRCKVIAQLHGKVMYLHGSAAYYYTQTAIKLDSVLHQRCQSLIFLTVMLFLSKADQLDLLGQQQNYIHVVDMISLLEYARITFSGYKQLLTAVLQIGAHTVQQPKLIQTQIEALQAKCKRAVNADETRPVGYFERKRIAFEEQQMYDKLYRESVQQWHERAEQYVNVLVHNQLLLRPTEMSDSSVADAVAKLHNTVQEGQKRLPLAPCYLRSGVSVPPTGSQLPFEYCTPATAAEYKNSNIVTVSRDFFYLGYMNEVAVNVNADNLQHIVLPFAVHYVNSTVKTINKRANHLTCTVLTQLKRQYVQETDIAQRHQFYNFIHQFVTWLVQLSVYNYPDVCAFESLTENYICAFNVLSGTTDSSTQLITLHLLKMLVDRINTLIHNNANTTNFALKLSKSVETQLTTVQIDKTKPASPLSKPTTNVVLLAVQLLQLIDLSLLHHALDVLEQLFVVHKANKAVSSAVAELACSVLKNAFDLYKRDECVNWYFRMCDKYELAS